MKKLDITNHWRLHSHCLCNYGNHKNFNITESLKMSLKTNRSFLVLKSLVLSDLKLWHWQIIPTTLITLGSLGSWTGFSFPHNLWAHCSFCGQKQKDKSFLSMSYAALPTTSVTIMIDWHALALVDLWPCRRSAHKRNSDLYDVTQGQTKKKHFLKFIRTLKDWHLEQKHSHMSNLASIFLRLWSCLAWESNYLAV